ncbi:MAG: cupin domain-containing protein [Alphaproteobacteria bacterium]|nr:cupin domain-containing protein [Alphaproteobacteria bacterium]
MSFIRFPLDELESRPFEAGAPKAERLIAGAPRFRTWTFEESADGKLFAGVWESTPGKWRIVYDEWEYCSILSGVSVITRDGEAPQRVQAGDTFVLQPGFEGAWEVAETTRKLFVVRLD